jgi:hypothetical protein
VEPRGDGGIVKEFYTFFAGARDGAITRHVEGVRSSCRLQS